MYAQKDYNEIQGIKGKYTIRQIGCFLTSFCNLAKRMGAEDYSPVQLNAIFRDRGIYIDVDDGIRDDLGWQSITAAIPSLVLSQTGTDPKAIPHNNTIVKFRYTGSAGFNTHFCIVDYVAANGDVYIIDSFDGAKKNGTARYGKPLAWAAYALNKPQPVVVIPPAAYDGNHVTIQPGWGLSHAAREAGYPDWKEEARWAAIAQLNGNANWKAYNDGLRPGDRIKVGKPPVTTAPAPVTPAPQPEKNYVEIKVQPGWGISHCLKAAGYSQAQFSNPAEWARFATLNGKNTLVAGEVVKVYKQPLDIAADPASEVPAPAETPAEVEEPVAPVDFRNTVVPFTSRVTAKEDAIIQDFARQRPPTQISVGQSFEAAQKFTHNDIVYVRSQNALSSDYWYGVPLSILEVEQPDDEDEDDELFKDLDSVDFGKELGEFVGHLSFREKIVAFVGKFLYLLSRLNPLNKNK